MSDLAVVESLGDVAEVDTSTETVDTSTVEQPVTDETTVETEAEEPADNEDKPADESSPDAAQKEWKPLMEKALKGDKASESKLRFAYFGYQALRKDFPGGVKEAREYRDTLAAVGGAEGIQELQADRQAIQAMDEQLMAGDPKFIATVAEEFGEGFSKLMPHALDMFYQKDPEQYSHVIGRVMFNSLQQSPIGEVYESLKADKPEIAAKLAAWYNGIRELASKVPEKKIDPERKKFEEEKQSFEQKKTEDFRTGVVSELRTGNAKDLDAELAKVFKANGKDYADFKKKNPDGCRVMLEQAYKNMLAEIDKDKSFVQQHNELLKRQQRDKLITAMQSRSRKAIPDAVKRAYRIFNFGAAKPNTVTAPAGSPGTKRLAKQPAPDQIDWGRVSDDEMENLIFSNKAYVKGQKEMVSW